MKIKSFLFLITLFSLLGFSIHPKNNLILTGPSYAKVKITPIATSDEGSVLCLTEHYLNHMGAHDLMDTEFGYLLVSKKGLWEEKVIKTIYTEDGYDSLEKFEKQFYQTLDFKNPPRYLAEIIEKHNITTTIYSHQSNLYFWTSKGLYNGDDKLIQENVVQKSIKNYQSISGKGTRIGNASLIKGILFFENYQTYHYETDKEIHAGAHFLEIKDEYPYEIYYVTGIVILEN